jgi:anti-anti-sigma factor
MLKLKIEDGVYRISFHKINRLNSYFADSIRMELIEIVSKPGREVILSMKGINFIDSSGLETLMDVVNQASEFGSRFRICEVSGDMYELLNLMKVRVLFEIDPVKAREFLPIV